MSYVTPNEKQYAVQQLKLKEKIICKKKEKGITDSLA
jgi:hypothetical protein